MNKPNDHTNYIHKEYSFSEVFEKAFELYKIIFANAGLVFLLFGIIQGLVSSSIQMLFYRFSIFSQDAVGIDLSTYDWKIQLGASFSNALLSGLTTPMIASIYYMCKYYLENQKQPTLSVFECYNPPYFQKIFIYGFSVTFILELIMLFFNQIELGWIGISMAILISYFTVLMLPILVLKNLNIQDSLTLCLKMTTKQTFTILLLIIVSGLFAVVGIVALCIGIIFTMPMIYIVLFCIYEHQFPINTSHEIDEIGKEF